jgi:hypothetical protein
MDVLPDWERLSLLTQLVFSMKALDLFNVEMLRHIHEVWSSVALTPQFHWSKIKEINLAIVKKALSFLPERSDVHQKHADIVVDLWGFPLGQLDLNMVPVKELDLRLRQARHDSS